MKKMSILILVLVGLAACALLGHRYARSTPPRGAPPAATEFKATNDWQQSVRVDPRTDYTVDDATRRRLREMLIREQQKQQPQEGKN